MTKSKRKRKGGLYSRINPEEKLGKNWRENFLKQTIEYYKGEQNNLFQEFNAISGGITTLAR